jgi:hypothetical protein
MREIKMKEAVVIVPVKGGIDEDALEKAPLMTHSVDGLLRHKMAIHIVDSWTSDLPSTPE